MALFLPARLSPFLFVTLLVLPACDSNQRFARLNRENQILREEKLLAEKAVQDCDKELAASQQQVHQVQNLGPDRPVALFAPVSIEIASLSGGADYDNQPGDDGVTVHLRPKDADGQVVKVPGKITIQLLDNSDMTKPKVVAVCEHEKPDDLRQLWMGILGTNHYTIRCPFPGGAALPESRRLLVNAAFVDFLTGRTLTASKEVSFSLAR